ncbi:MAG: hypothetical protein HIU92_16300 [Proteobacteria bacterium]|nr:hypothetical protein [Pseudomonadota bacterium]
MRTSVAALSLTMAMTYHIGSVRADVVLVGNITEHYSAATDVAGEVLVGLRVGSQSGPVILPNMHIALPTRSRAEMACVDATTGDGRYALQGVFPVPVGPAEEGLLKAHWADSVLLRQYNSGEFALRTALKASCGDADPGTLVPSVSTKGDPSTLVAFVNGQRAVEVTATLNNAANALLATGTCHGIASERSIAFDTVCTFPISDIKTQNIDQITINRLTRAGDIDSDSFSVELAPKAW